MKTRTTLEKAIGKTLTGTVNSWYGQLLLVFGDEYVCLGVDRGYESGDETIEEEDLDLFGFGDEKLIEGGIISESEMKGARHEKEMKEMGFKERRERLLYLQLRNKFEDKLSE